MSMAAHPSRTEIACGINSSEDALKSGSNQNCRVYSVKDKKCVVYFLLPMFRSSRILGYHPLKRGVH